MSKKKKLVYDGYKYNYYDYDYDYLNLDKEPKYKSYFSRPKCFSNHCHFKVGKGYIFGGSNLSMKEDTLELFKSIDKKDMIRILFENPKFTVYWSIEKEKEFFEIDKRGYYGVVYLPVEDGGIPSLDKDTLRKLLGNLLEKIKNGKSVYIHCLGGHGRTGLIIACLLKLAGEKDPIEKVRKEYCERAIETIKQEDFIKNF